jgi:hypothetical protein
LRRRLGLPEAPASCDPEAFLVRGAAVETMLILLKLPRRALDRSPVDIAPLRSDHDEAM